MIATNHWARTRDGIDLALYNYRPATLEPHRLPVFLVHGLGSNRSDLDYPGGDQSLARYLCRGGHDVWIVEMRGAGRSTKPGLFSRLRYNWVLDDYIVHDIPAAIARVLQLSGRPAVHWVGHSMGGMLAYPFLTMSDPGLVRSCITVGAPILARLSHKAFDVAHKNLWMANFIPFIPHRHTGRLAAPFVGIFRARIEKLLGNFLYNPRNMTSETLATLLRTAVENLPVSIMKQLGSVYGDQHFRSFYGTFSVRDNLQRIETPTLVIAGSVDEMTPPEDLRFVFDRLGSPTKEFVVIGKESGATDDYGHVDLILGKNAPIDVFPTIAAWIRRHEAPPGAPEDRREEPSPGKKAAAA